MKRFTFILFAFLVLVSCKDEPLEKYEGIWVGNFTGTQEGTWKVFVDADGKIKGTAKPLDFDGNSFALNGLITEDGKVTLKANVLNRELIFNAYASESDLAGNWWSDDGSNEGNWQGIKEIREERFPYNRLLNP